MSFLASLRRLLAGGLEGRAARQEGDVHALDREGDPRGGVQSDDYRTADPRDVVEEGGVAMSGPAGSPQEGTAADHQRENKRN